MRWDIHEHHSFSSSSLERWCLNSRISTNRLVHLENLSRELGRAVYVKRDDALGPVCGGNKTRKLEYLLADAIEAGATKIVTVGGPQSNHARLTAAAARMLGLEPHLLLFGSRPKRAVGNLLLDQLVGAELHFIPPGPIASGACTFEELDAYVRENRRRNESAITIMCRSEARTGSVRLDMSGPHSRSGSRRNLLAHGRPARFVRRTA